MGEVRIDRLFTAWRGLIFYAMKKLNPTAETSLYRNPTDRELYALERLAREERARAVAVLLVSGAAAIRSASRCAVAALTAKVVRHA
jgi:hypothetical protein